MMEHWTHAAREAAGKALRIWGIVALVVAVAIVLIAISPRVTLRIGGTTYELQRVVEQP